MKKPPPVNPLKPHGDLYDSVVDNPSDPSVFVVFEFDQCYPEFLISYVTINPGVAGRYIPVVCIGIVAMDLSLGSCKEGGSYAESLKGNSIAAI